MRHASMMKLTLFSLSAAGALASGFLQFETSALDVRRTVASEPSEDRSLQLTKKLVLGDVDLVETHARPLFSQNRRPFVVKPPVIEQPQEVVAAAAVEQPVTLPRRLTLIGTNTGTSAASVLVRNQESAEVRWLKVGETFDGWTLSHSTADSASFTCEEQQTEDCQYRLTLYSDTRSE